MLFQRGRLTAIAGIVATSIALSGTAPAYAEPVAADRITSAASNLERASESVAKAAAPQNKAEIEAKIEAKKQEIAELEKQQGVANANAASLTDKVKELKEQLAKLETELSKAESSKTVEAAATNLVDNINSAQKAVSIVKDSLDPADLKKAQDAIAAAERVAVDTENQLTGLKEKSDADGAEVANAEKAVADAKSALAAANQDLEAAKANLVKTENNDAATLDEFTTQQKELKKQIQELEKELATVEAEAERLNNVAKNLEPLVAELNAHKAELADAADREEALNAAGARASDEELQGAAEKLKQLQAEVAALEAEISKANQAIADNAELKQAKEELDQAHQTFREKQLELERAERAGAEHLKLQEQRNELTGQVERKEGELELLRSNITDTQALLDSLPEAEKRLNKAIEKEIDAKIKLISSRQLLPLLRRLESTPEEDFTTTVDEIIGNNRDRVEAAEKKLQEAKASGDIQSIRAARLEFGVADTLDTLLTNSTSSSLDVKRNLSQGELEATKNDQLHAVAEAETNKAKEPFGDTTPSTKIQEVQRQLITLQSRVEPLEEEITQLKNELGQLANVTIDAPDAAPADPQQAYEEAQRAVDEALRVMNQKNDAFNRLAEGVDAVDSDELVGKMAERDKKSEEILKLQTLADYAHLVELKKKIERAEQEKARLEKELESQDGVLKNLETVKGKIAQLRDQVSTTPPALAAPEARKQVQELEQKVNDLQAKATGAEEKLTEARNKQAESATALAEARTKGIETLDAAVNKLKLDIATWTTELVEHQAANAQEEVKQVQAKLDKANTELAELEKLRDSFKEPKPQDPKPQDPKPQDPKPEDPKGNKPIVPPFIKIPDGNNQDNTPSWWSWFTPNFSFAGLLASIFGFVLAKFFGIKLW